MTKVSGNPDLQSGSNSVVLQRNAETTGDLIGHSPKFLTAVGIAKLVAKSSSNILLTGESGTGKEIFANFIHRSSAHRKGPFSAINCSSIPNELLESELFGHAKGSFTGALEKRVGLFEAAQDGTVFLDEIGDLSLPMQAKLLRVLQERKIKRIGENREISINCRFISATHKDLPLEINQGRFREDLFFRLNVIPIIIPPLRERQEDILVLADIFLKRFALENSSTATSFSKEAQDYILAKKWQGNVRELENYVERAVVLCEDSEISLEHFLPLNGIPLAPGPLPSELADVDNTFILKYLSHLPSLNEVVNKYIEYAIYKNGGAKDKAAKQIGIDRKTLYRRLHVDRGEQ